VKTVDFKAELRHPAAAKAQCAGLRAEGGGTVRLRDTWYRVADGRLLRRETIGGDVEWIRYHRADGVQPRVCEAVPLTDGQARRRFGKQNLPVLVTIERTRSTYVIGNVRVLLDSVDGLGDFIELQAIVSREFDVETCSDQIAVMRDALAPILGEPVALSYAELATA
jgi:hypothetical protein